MKTAEERESWLAERRNFVTASDVAAVMGISPHKNRKAVFKDKVYGGVNDIDRLPMVMAGKHLEAGVLGWHLAHRDFVGVSWDSTGVHDYVRRMLGAGTFSRITESGLVKHPTSKVLAATPDALVNAREGSVWVTEIKNVDKDKAPHGKNQGAADWAKTYRGPSGWNNIPDACVLHAMPYQKIDKDELRAPIYYWAQLQAQMSCLGIPRGRIVVCFGGNVRADLDYHLDVEFEAKMLRDLDNFWDEVITARELHEP